MIYTYRYSYGVRLCIANLLYWIDYVLEMFVRIVYASCIRVFVAYATTSYLCRCDGVLVPWSDRIVELSSHSLPELADWMGDTDTGIGMTIQTSHHMS